MKTIVATRWILSMCIAAGVADSMKMPSELLHQRPRTLQHRDRLVVEETGDVSPLSSTSFVRRQERSLGGYYYTDTLVDGLETAYDEYAQAWRMLGMYIDCGDADYNAAAAGRRRRLEDAADANDGEEDAADEDAGDQDEVQEEAADDEGDADAAADNQQEAVECKRYLLWAAVS